MAGKRAFTLVELLVVISIISLLMSILLPSLNKARGQAKQAVCKSNLKQWGVVFLQYSSENNGRFFAGWMGDTLTKASDQWPSALRRYYMNPKLRLCPNAMKFTGLGENPNSSIEPLSATEAWGIFSKDPGWAVEAGDYGSYGINAWICNPLPNTPIFPKPPLRNAYWRGPDVKNTSDIPLFLDSYWMELWCTDTEQPPAFPMAAFLDNPAGQGRSCILRHGKKANIVYMDGSVRDVKLRQLWDQKWHREYKFDKIATIKWPDWLKE